MVWEDGGGDPASYPIACSRLITAAITAVAYYLLGVPVIVALLPGAALASTDPPTLVPAWLAQRLSMN